MSYAAPTMLGLIVICGGLLAVSNAMLSRSVTFDTFDTPAALATAGVTGKVVTEDLLDVWKLIDASVGERKGSNDWSVGGIKVDNLSLLVNDQATASSLGALSLFLKSYLGRNSRISGELVQTATGNLELTVRGDGVLPKTFTSGPGQLESLTWQAGEYVYSQFRPSLFASYLVDTARNEEAIRFSEAASYKAPPSEQPRLLNAWANALGNKGGSAKQTLALYRAALALKPDYWVAYNNVMDSDISIGDEEGAWQAGEKMREQAGGRPGAASELYYQNWDMLTWNLQAWRAATLADARTRARGDILSQVDAVGIADIDARLHDLADAELQLQTAQSGNSDSSVAAMTHFVRGRLAAEAGDTASAAAEMEAFGAAYANPVVSTNYSGYSCWIAPAEEAAGHPDRADAVIKTSGHYVDCYRFRADELNNRGKWAEAQRAYADAVAIAPDLPAAYYSWGVALASHGDLTGALEKLTAANARGLHWADPLKAWGDVLARQGKWSEASAKYDSAMVYAPNWLSLREARDQAAAHQK